MGQPGNPRHPATPVVPAGTVVPAGLVVPVGLVRGCAAALEVVPLVRETTRGFANQDHNL